MSKHTPCSFDTRNAFSHPGPVAGVEVAALEAAGPFGRTKPVALNPMSSRNHSTPLHMGKLVILLGHAFL